MDEPAAARCPWCSSLLADASAATCPTCGATLAPASADAQIPGVTTVSPEVIVRAKPVRRSRLLAWISGEVSDDVLAPRSPEGALAPPADSVRLEILRIEREAAVARGDVASSVPEAEPPGVPIEATDGEDAASPEPS